MNFLNSVYLVLKNQFPKTGHGRYLMTIILAFGKLRQEDCHKLETSLGFILNSRSPYLNTLVSQPKRHRSLCFPGNRGRESSEVQPLGILPGYHCCEIH